MDNVEICYHCEICHIMYTESDLIAVEGIEYLRWERLFPWYICKGCAEKISDALKEKEGKNE